MTSRTQASAAKRPHRQHRRQDRRHRQNNAAAGNDSGHHELSDLSRLLDIIEDVAGKNSQVSFGQIYDAIGHRSFGPLLLVAGIIVLMPVVGDIPGVPTIMGAVVVLIAGQLLARRKQFWLPRRVLNASLRSSKVCKGVGWLRKPAGAIDRLLRPRLTRFVTGAWVFVIAATALVVGLAQPFMELVPFSANGAGAVLTAFGLALIAHDGLVALVALGLALLTGGIVGYVLIA